MKRPIWTLPVRLAVFCLTWTGVYWIVVTPQGARFGNDLYYRISGQPKRPGAVRLKAEEVDKLREDYEKSKKQQKPESNKPEAKK
jgi:hypothetical protein